MEFGLATSAGGSYLAGMGIACGDFDSDGRIDLLMVVENEPVVFFHNQTPSPGHFLPLSLEGTASNRDGVGARVAVTCAGQTRVAARFGGGSYMSALGSRLHFGLGQARSIDRVEVTWPSGKRDTYLGLAADTGYHLREGDPAPKPLRGFRALLPAP
jgi:enediyne biosynthesis protein E4